MYIKDGSSTTDDKIRTPLCWMNTKDYVYASPRPLGDKNEKSDKDNEWRKKLKSKYTNSIDSSWIIYSI